MEEKFSLASLPPQIPLVSPTVEEQKLIVFHAEAQYALRTLMIEVAQRHFKNELHKLNLETFVEHLHQKTSQLIEKFEERVSKHFKYDGAKPVPIFDTLTCSGEK